MFRVQGDLFESGSHLDPTVEHLQCPGAETKSRSAMAVHFQRFVAIILLAHFINPFFYLSAQTGKATSTAVDKLDRTNPRSSVTSFLQACRRQDYEVAAQYLDLRYLPDNKRNNRGPELARRLESALNIASDFNILQLSQNSEGMSANDVNPPRLRVTTFSHAGETYPVSLERVLLQPGQPALWLFSPDTVTALLGTNLSASAPWFVHYLPRIRLISLRPVVHDDWQGEPGPLY